MIRFSKQTLVALKSSEDRRLVRIGSLGLIITVLFVMAFQNYGKLPVINASTVYSGYFADIGGLATGDKVMIAGVPTGLVQRIELRGDKVKVSFSADGVVLGSKTELSIKTRTLLGSKYLEVRSAGTGQLRPSATIPLSRTTSPYLLTDALSDLTTTIGGLKTDQVSASLDSLSKVLDTAEPNVSAALTGVTRFSETVGSRDDLIGELLSNADRVTGVLSERSSQLQQLLIDGDRLLGTVAERRNAIDNLLVNITRLSDQVQMFIDENNFQLKPVLDQLRKTTALLAKHRDDLKDSVLPLSQYATSLGESVSSGPFFKGYIMNLLPGQFLQPFIDAAFKKRGIDPASLARDAKRLTTAPKPAAPNARGGN